MNIKKRIDEYTNNGIGREYNLYRFYHTLNDKPMTQEDVDDINNAMEEDVSKSFILHPNTAIDQEEASEWPLEWLEQELGIELSYDTNRGGVLYNGRRLSNEEWTAFYSRYRNNVRSPLSFNEFRSVICETVILGYEGE